MKLVFLLLSILHAAVFSQNQSSNSNSTTPPLFQFPPSAPAETCFIDEKFREEVEIFYIIGVRYPDRKWSISDRSGFFDFRFFEDPWNSMIMNSSMNSTIPLIQNFNQTSIEDITVAWTPPLFHFVTPGRPIRVNYFNYSAIEMATLKKESFPDKGTFEKNHGIHGSYTCHFNVRRNYTACVSIINQLVTVTIFWETGDAKQNTFSLPGYLSFDKFFSYADNYGQDYILIHHKAQWIYRIDYQMYLLNQNMFFKVFHLRKTNEFFFFDDFEHADEYGLVTRYKNDQGSYRYYYSLFNETAGLATYCVYNKFIDGRLMILARKRVHQEKGFIQSLISGPKHEEIIDEFEIPTMLRVLFYCAAVYLTIFMTTQMIPNRRSMIFKDLRHAEREFQRLGPVIEVVVGKVHTYLDGMKKKNVSKDT